MNKLINARLKKVQEKPHWADFCQSGETASSKNRSYSNSLNLPLRSRSYINTELNFVEFVKGHNTSWLVGKHGINNKNKRSREKLAVLWRTSLRNLEKPQRHRGKDIKPDSLNKFRQAGGELKEVSNMSQNYKTTGLMSKNYISG